jgi:hypothetical protein|tara:strand:+ start:1749 stop:2054 length:306 start_codon:yes stop_codon:yes gene_type:complete
MYGENTIQYSKEQSDSYSKLQEDRFNKSISLKDKIKNKIGITMWSAYLLLPFTIIFLSWFIVIIISLIYNKGILILNIKIIILLIIFNIFTFFLVDFGSLI